MRVIRLGMIVAAGLFATAALAQPAPTAWREIPCTDSRLGISTPDRVVCQRRENFTPTLQLPLPLYNAYIAAEGKHLSVTVETSHQTTSILNVPEATRLTRLKGFNSVTQRGRDWTELRAGPDGTQIARFTSEGGSQCFVLYKPGPLHNVGFAWLMWSSACEIRGMELNDARIEAIYRQIQFR